MKTLHIASILVLSSLTVFACGDDDDTTNNNNKGGTAGQSAGGEAGSPIDNGGSAGKAGGGGTTATMAGGGAGGEGGALVPCVDDVIGGAGGAGDAGGAAQGGAAGAAGAGGDATVSTALEIIGAWKESFGGDLVITSARWNDGTILEYDNDANVVYTHNSCADFNPGKYSRYVYTNPENDSFYYCTIVYDAPTLQDAKTYENIADAKDLDGKGCNGFPWSKVTKL